MKRSPEPKKLVYIAGPYSKPDPVQNTNEAIRFGLQIRDAFNVAVIIPHLTLLAHMVTPRNIEYWYSFDLDQLDHCDALFRLRGESKGADLEVAYAEDRGIPVLHQISELQRWLYA